MESMKIELLHSEDQWAAWMFQFKITLIAVGAYEVVTCDEAKPQDNATLKL